MISLTPGQARRLFVHKQRLTEWAPGRNPPALLDLIRGLGCVQLDPINVVARTHQLVLFSRLGSYALTDLDRLLWQERALFEYWAHCASIVLTEDYPLHAPMMRAYPWSERTRAWIRDNQKLKRYVLGQIRRHGPLPSRALTEDGLQPEAWVSTGWTSGRNISRMLDFLWIGGQIMVAGRDGLQKLWDLSERVLPEWTPRHRLVEREVTRQAALRALAALGAATPTHITHHFLRGRYPDLPRVLAALERNAHIQQVDIPGWKGTWYITPEDYALAVQLEAEFAPRTVLLSPFDNLICDRARTRQYFDFDFTIEIYVPPAKRRYGYYVLPILQGDALIGRLDPQMDREHGILTVNAVYAEAAAPRAAGPAVAQAVQDLAAFLGAHTIQYDRRRVPAFWKKAF